MRRKKQPRVGTMSINSWPEYRLFRMPQNKWVVQIRRLWQLEHQRTAIRVLPTVGFQNNHQPHTQSHHNAIVEDGP